MATARKRKSRKSTALATRPKKRKAKRATKRAIRKTKRVVRRAKHTAASTRRAVKKAVKKYKKRAKKRARSKMTTAQARHVVNMILNHSRMIREGTNNTLDKEQTEEMVRNLEHVCGGSKARGINYLMARFQLTRKAATWYVAEYCAATQKEGVYFAESDEYDEAAESEEEEEALPRKRWYDLSF